MTARSLHDLNEELSEAVMLAEALIFIADGIVYSGDLKTGEAVGAVAAILLERLQGLKAGMTAIAGEAAL
ncbi:hypothetical protein [Pseudochelatococcus contaminans]|uniref:Uncharacterized protein n=1 Tax=Pseudochelatococcus contaminans TaxID=1538103 RepID=A0A7W5Z541_9HYPH|nr:hypothetical protein [Pseudochelatococcus contaminans]MBB3809867.1 hypothetical protein [Pseudochelatococcus contaminans]